MILGCYWQQLLVMARAKLSSEEYVKSGRAQAYKKRVSPGAEKPDIPPAFGVLGTPPKRHI